MRARTQSLSLPPASVDTRLLTSRDNCKPLMAGCDHRRCASLHLWIYRSITWMGMNLVVAAALGMSMMSAAATSSSDATTAVEESGHCDLTRSLGATIMASLSTLALFGAANWGHSFMFDTSLVDRIINHIGLSYLNPGLSFFITFFNSMAVREYNNNMVPLLQDSYHRSTIAIITNCPIFIPILVSLDSSILADLLDALCLEKDDILSREQVDESCPLELSPATGGSAAAASSSSTAKIYPSPQLMRRTHSDSVLVSHQQHDDLPDNISLPQMKFLKLTYDPAKKGLLELGLIPKQEQLRFLRSRNSFQEVVVCFQACGYVLGVALRVFQRLPISPLEAVLTILCILVVCQTAVSIYACSHFQRPLLLRLDQQQFVQWSQHIITARYRQDPPVTVNILGISWRRAVVGFWVSTILLFAIPSIYYTVRPAQHFSLSCVFSALLFLSYAIFTFTFVAVAMLPAPYDIWIGIPSAFLAMAAFFSSILLALISTIKDWYIFDQRTENSFAWILPHVSPTS